MLEKSFDSLVIAIAIYYLCTGVKRSLLHTAFASCEQKF